MAPQADEHPILIGQTGPLDGQRWTIAGPIIVGRDSTSDIVVADRQVSRHHARFTLSSGGISVEDLDSKNGTHVNGQRIDERTSLQDGDVVQVALAQQFVYLSSDATLPLDLNESTELMAPQGKLLIDKKSRRVWISEDEITPPLSVAQFTLLDTLYQRRGRVVTREELVRAIWDEEDAYEVSNQALDALVRRLRDRLAAVDNQHDYIITVRGHGLRLDNPKD